MPQLGGGQLDAVVAAQGERLGIDTSFFDQGLADLGDREARPGQARPGLARIVQPWNGPGPIQLGWPP